MSLIPAYQMFHMNHTMHAIQLDQAHSHHRVLKRFTQGVPRLRLKFEDILRQVLRQKFERLDFVEGEYKFMVSLCTVHAWLTTHLQRLGTSFWIFASARDSGACQLLLLLWGLRWQGPQPRIKFES